MAFCMKCGNHLGETAAFCGKCGTASVDQTAAGAAQGTAETETPAKGKIRLTKKWPFVLIGGLVGIAILASLLPSPDDQKKPQKKVAGSASIKVESGALQRKQPDRAMTGEEIIANASPNTPQEEAAGFRAFCDQARNIDLNKAAKDMSAMMAFMLRADQEMVDRTGEPLDRANIVVTRVARAFGQQIYGPSDCASALRD